MMKKGSVWRKQGHQMFSFFNPYVIVSFVLALIGVYFYGHHSGYQERVVEDQAEIVRLNDEARAKEEELGEKLARTTSQLKKAKKDVQAKQYSLNARIDSGELRLPSTCGVQANSSTTTGNPANESDIERQTIKDIVSLTTEGDNAIISLNACIAQYNQVRETVNQGVK
jgi:hypothetical protein